VAHLRNPVSNADHSQGATDAPVTLVEYGDYQCPSCGAAYPVVKKLQRKLGKDLRFVFRNFPLENVHPNAMHAARAAESVSELGGEGPFWLMHDLLFEHQDSLDDTHLARYASQAGVDGDAVARALANGDQLERVQADFAGGIRSGVNGTPTFFVNGERYDGDWSDVATFHDALVEAAKPSGSR
jgi:protein-disulfide isomerase